MKSKITAYRNGLIFLLLFIQSFVFSQTFDPIRYWNGDGPNTATTIDDSKNGYDLNLAAYAPNVVHIANTSPKVGNYIQLRSDNSIILASPTTSPLTDTVCVEFMMRFTRDFFGGSVIADKSGAFKISFSIPQRAYIRPSVTFQTQTGTGGGTYNELTVLFDAVGRKSWGWISDGEWHHFVFQYKPSTGLKEVWIDGQRPTTDFYNNTTPGSLVRPASAFGLFLNESVDYYKCFADIDEIALYNRFLTPQIIQQHIVDINAGQHYSNTTGITAPATVSPTTAPIDIEEYPVGHQNMTVCFDDDYNQTGHASTPCINMTASKEPTNSALTQIKTFPLPRFRKGHNLPRNFPWYSIEYVAGQGQVGAAVTVPALYTQISNALFLQNVTDFLHETTWNWNLAISSPDRGRTSEYVTSMSPITYNMNFPNGRIAKFANDSLKYPNTIIILRAQVPGCLACSKGLASNLYLQNSSGSFLTAQGAVASSPQWLRPSNNPLGFTQDGDNMKALVQAYVNVLPARPVDSVITEINEDGETQAYLEQAAMQLDPVVVADKNASGLTWDQYRAQRMLDFEKISYRDRIMSITGLQKSVFTQYRVNGSDNEHWYYPIFRNLNTLKENGQFRSTGDLYPLVPRGWYSWVTAWNGLRHFTQARTLEIASGDEYMHPFVNAGYVPDEETTVRPAQYLGLLKLMTGLGANRFYDSYFVERQPWQIPGNYIWQIAMPIYAQAVNSKVWEIYTNSTLLAGDGTWDYNNPASGPSYLFNTGDYRKPCIVRKWKGGAKYLIYTAFMNNTNMTDTNTYQGSFLVNFDGLSNIQLTTRRQGSVYLLDNTVSPPTIVQLDGWHERKHPERWSQDIIIEAEMPDNGTYAVKTEGATGYNFLNSTSYLTGSSLITYNVQRAENSPATRYFWIRARSRTGLSTSATISLNGSTGKKIDCITSTNWNWYRVENLNGTPISYTMNAKGIYDLTVLPNANGLLEIDKVALLVSNADVYGAVVTACSGTTATITPGGPTTFCTGGSVVLTANVADSYLWSNGAVTQAITASTSGSYTVTVTIAGVPGISNPTVVTVTPLPTATITAGGATSFCQGANVILTAASGTGYTYQWQESGVNISFATSQSYSVNAAGNYTCVVTANSCSATSNTISTSILTAPTVTITPSGPTTFCSGGSITLSATSNTSYLWSTGATTQTINVSTPNNYTVTVTGSNGCTKTSTPLTVMVNSLPTASISSPTTTFCSGGSVLLTAVTGTGYSYQWQSNSVNISGATASTYSAVATGTYRVITTASGCTATSNTITLNSIATPTTANAGVDQNVCVDSTILAGNTAINGSGLWTLVSGTGTIVTPTSPTSVVRGLSTGAAVFKWTISNSPCNSNSDNVTVTRSGSNAASVTITANQNPFCNGATVTFTAAPVNGGTATYQWKKNGVNAGTNSITYSATFADLDTVQVVMTSSLGCATGSPASSNKIGLSASTVSASITPGGATTFCQGSSVVLTANAGGGLTYQWKNASGNIIGATNINYTATTAGTYSCIVTNAQGCSLTSNSITTVVNPLPASVITPNGSTSFCVGGNVMLSATSAVSYLWSTGAIVQTITVASAGTYTVTVTDGNGCSAASPPIDISNGALPTAVITPSSDVTICYGTTRTLSANTGTGLTYKWYRSGINTGVTTPSYIADVTGDYYVIVTNASSCSKSSDTATINISAPVTVTVSNSRPLVFCGSDSTVLTSSTATSYVWSTGATTRSIAVYVSGVYAVTATNLVGCTGTSNPITVSANSVAQATIIPNHTPNVCGSAPNQINLTSSLAQSYQWSTGATTNMISPGAGTYRVTVTYSSGCTSVSAPLVVTDTCVATACGIPFGLYTDQNDKSWFCFGGYCGYARANWSMGNFNADSYVLYYKNLSTGRVIRVEKNGSMRRAYMYGLQNNTNYQWWLTAVCGGVETAKSEIINFKTKK